MAARLLTDIPSSLYIPDVRASLSMAVSCNRLVAPHRGRRVSRGRLVQRDRVGQVSLALRGQDGQSSKFSRLAGSLMKVQVSDPMTTTPGRPRAHQVSKALCSSSPSPSLVLTSLVVVQAPVQVLIRFTFRKTEMQTEFRAAHEYFPAAASPRQKRMTKI